MLAILVFLLVFTATVGGRRLPAREAVAFAAGAISRISRAERAGLRLGHSHGMRRGSRSRAFR